MKLKTMFWIVKQINKLSYAIGYIKGLMTGVVIGYVLYVIL